MYRKKDRSAQRQIHMLCIEELVPKNHLLREIDKAISFDFIYEDVKGLYKEAEWGNPGIDPVSLFKIVFIQYIYGIRSMRQTIKEIEVNNAYRWFIGYDLMEPIPHFSTFSKNYTRRFKDTDVFQKIFTHILEEAVRCGFIDASAIYIDGTHIRANANKNKSVKEIVKKEAKQYQADLDEEIRRDREAHGKKPLKEKDSDNGGTEGKDSENSSDSSDMSEAKITDKEAETAAITKSTTDPECGMFQKGEHERQFAYVTNAACDNNNFVLAFTVGAGNIHDSVMFDKVFGRVKELFPEEIDTVTVDSAYRTPWIAKQIIDSGMKPAMPYKRPMTPKGYFRKHEYVYDEYYDCYLCPNNQVLKYSTTNREGYREYKSNPDICRNCQYRSQCTNSKSCQKTVTRHVWEAYIEAVEDLRHTPEIKAIYERRKETIERVFADAKVKHGLRFTQLRGLAKVTMQVTLTFACMNLKKLAKLKGKSSSPSLLWNYLVIPASLFIKFKPRFLAFA
jgi:transposase